MTYGLPIKAIHGEIDNIAEALFFEHKALDAMTLELNKLLKKAHWISQSNQSFQQIMAKYNLHMSELHAELNRLAAALQAANRDLLETDAKVAKTFQG